MIDPYISPHLPGQIRGLYDSDMRERSIKLMLDLAADLIEELTDLKSRIREHDLAEVIADAYESDAARLQGVNKHDLRAARAVISHLEGKR